jgi:single-strand DNA-binding protein
MIMVNSVMIEGYVGSDVESRFSNAGMQIVKFAVSIPAGKKQADGSYSNEYHYVDCVCFGKTAEAAARLQKKDRIMVAGKIQQEKWQDKQSGQNRSRVSLILDAVAKGPSNQQSQNPIPQRAPQQQQAPSVRQPDLVPDQVYESLVPNFEDDIPF